MANLREVRGEIAHLATAENVPAAVEEYVGNPMSAPHRKLKIGQYALLIQPVTEGMRAFLDDERPIRKASTPNDLVRAIQLQLECAFEETLQTSPHYPLIQAIHEARYMQHAFGAARFRFKETFQAAISFSAATMYEAACANAAVIMSANDPALDDSVDFHNAVVGSIQLPLAETRLHFEYLVGGGAAQVRKVTDGTQPEYMYYDPVERIAKLRQPLPAWAVGFKSPMRGDSVVDPRVGCPLSFAPDLVIDYYQKVAQEQSIQGIWEPLRYATLTEGGLF